MSRSHLVLLAKSQGQFKHSGKYYLYNGRWHKLHPDKPAPKHAPVSAHPHSAGSHVPKQVFTDAQWEQLKLPDSNVNAPSYNKKLAELKSHADAGDMTAILGSSFGTNTYGKKLSMVANSLLSAYGVAHKVAPGQKAGEHHAVNAAPAEHVQAKDEALQAAVDHLKEDAKQGNIPAEEKAEDAALIGKLVAAQSAFGEPEEKPELTGSVQAPVSAFGDAPAATMYMPSFVEAKHKTGVVQYYEKVAQKVIGLAASGDVAGLEQLKADGLKPSSTGKVSQTWSGNTTNSKLLLELHAQALDKAKGATVPAQPADPAPAPAAPEVMPPAPEVEVAAPEVTATSKVSLIPWAAQLLPDSNSNAKSHNKQVAKIKALAEAGDLAGLEAFNAGKNTYGQKQMKLAALAIAALKESAPEPVAAAEPAPNPAASNPAALSNDELVPVAGYDTLISSGKQKIDATNKSAMAGDIETVAKLAGEYEANSGPHTSSAIHAKHTLKKMQAKAASVTVSAPTEPADLPPTPKLKDFNNKLVVVTWHKMIADGNLKETADSVYKLASVAKDNPSMQKDDDILGLLQHGLELVKWIKSKGVTSAQAQPDPAEPEGPKEGDTKHGADGTLVFKNGRWHKYVDTDEHGELPPVLVPVDDVQPSAPAYKKLKPAHAISLGKHLNTATGNKAKLKAMAVAGDGQALKDFIDSHPSMHASNKYAQKLLDAMSAGGGDDEPAQKPKAKPKSAKAAPAEAKHANVESIDGWEQTGGQGGSNPGGKFKDQHGVEWYCKFPGDEDVAKSEVLAAKLYQLAGVAGQDAKLITNGGKLGIASRWVDVSKSSASQLANTEGAQSGFAADAWLANWDVVGLGYDNLQIGADGKAVRIDAGGSLQYRAQGGKKAFGPSVTEIDSLRDPKINAQSAAVFGSMTKADITASVKKIADISDDDIYEAVMQHGPGSIEEKANLIDTLIARKNDLLEKFPKAVKKEKPKKKPDPTALKVDVSQLPPTHDFLNWSGQGKGLSSKAHVNEMNLKAEQDLLAFAAKGNLIALKDYHFEAIDKETGQSQGMKPINEHPSQHVKVYWSDLVSTLSYIANPPEALKKFKSVVAASISKVSDAFKSAKYGTTTDKVDANARLAFWIALGHTKPAESLLPNGASLEFQIDPAGRPHMSSQIKQQAQAAYSALTSIRPVKRFINGIQSSGSYNDNFRDGRMVTTDGHDATDMVLDAYDYATEKPEGFEIYKWASFPGNMGNQLLNTPPGTVFQNPGSMCCSYHPTSTKGFGPDRMRIRYAKGAKAVDSFGSGNYSSEQEITTLPGQRFVILSCKKVMCPAKGKERIELDVLMLPPDPGYVSELQANKGQYGKVAA